MDWKQFVAQILASVSWPLLVITILLIFKAEFTKVIQRLGHLKYKDFELEFNKVKQRAEELHKDLPKDQPAPKSPVFISLEDQIFDAVDSAPSAAILLAWSSLETAMASTVARLAISPESPSYRSPLHNIEMLSKYGSLPQHYANLLQEMRMLRNNVAHERDAMLSVTRDQALAYANAANDIIQLLEQPR